MRVLALETSERVGTIATLEVQNQQAPAVRQVSLPEGQRTAQSLLPAVQSLLSETGWKANQLDLIAVSTGPGSFTGLRMGVTTAKTLAYATDTKLAEVHTLVATAAGVTQTYERLWTVLDAQRNELFATCFSPDWQEGAEGHPETRIVGVEQWLEELKEGDVVCGPPLKKIADRLPGGVSAAASSEWAPSAENVGLLGIVASEKNCLVDAIQLVPRYYRKSAAEEKAGL